MSPNEDDPIVYDNDFTIPEDQNFISDDTCPGRHPEFEHEIVPEEDSDASE